MRLPGAAILVGAALFLAVLPGGAQQRGTDKLREEIRKAWQDRESRIKSARVAWVEKTTIPKGHLTNLLPAGPTRDEALQQMGIPKGAVVPPQDTTFDVPVTVVLKDGALKVTREGRSWDGKKRDYVRTPRVTSFDGSLESNLHPDGTPLVRFPSGSIHKAKRPREATVLHNVPVFMTLRPTTPGMLPWSLDDLDVVSQDTKIRGQACVELQRRRGGHIQRLWLDRDKGYSLVRYSETVDGRAVTSLDIQHKKDTTASWFPVAWSLALRRANGQLLDSVQARLREYELNPTLEKKDLTITFPPGAGVSDRAATPPGYFVVRPDGSRRHLSPEERQRTAKARASGVPLEDEPDIARSPLRWPLIVGGAVLLLSVCVFVGRRLGRRWGAA